jgi:hypothetical protein
MATYSYLFKYIIIGDTGMLSQWYKNWSIYSNKRFCFQTQCLCHHQ